MLGDLQQQLQKVLLCFISAITDIWKRNSFSCFNLKLWCVNMEKRIAEQCFTLVVVYVQSLSVYMNTNKSIAVSKCAGWRWFIIAQRSGLYICPSLLSLSDGSSNVGYWVSGVLISELAPKELGELLTLMHRLFNQNFLYQLPCVWKTD